MRKRLFVSTLILLLLLQVASCSSENRDESEELVVVSYGGAYQEGQRKAFFEPFAAQEGIRIREETHSGDLAKIKAMVESGNVTWDVMDVEAYMVLRGASDNLYEPIDLSLIPTEELFSEAVHEFGIAACFWSTIVAYNTDHFAESHPNGWAEFWDTGRFPGPRGLRRDPVANLEFALVADGVTPDRLYPLDINRGFRKLDEIKDDVIVWWEAGQQPPQLLASGELILSTAWNGRIFNARQEGKPVDVDWRDGAISSDWWIVPRGAKNKDLAMRFISFASSPLQQAAFANSIPYGPINRKAFEHIPAEVARNLPTSPENLEKQFFINKEWWDENIDNVITKWTEWLLK